jgi:organic radical activating enzyme
VSTVFKIQNINSSERSYYCSAKFKFLKIDLESKNTYNCHAAMSHPIDFEWLRHNPGNLFNTDVNVTERQMMLDNQRNPSCEQNCWKAEDQGAQSPRLISKGTKVTHTETRIAPEIIDLTIGADCNLSCSYCCKEFSSTWRRDIVINGDYKIDSIIDDRYTATTKDRVLLKISQPELKNTEDYQILLNEINLAAPTLKKLIVTGGEPLLNNFLIDNLQNLKLSKQCTVKIITGLGVSRSRFIKILNKLKHTPNLEIEISGETTEQLFEFNRYGAKWNEFVEKINLLKQNSINIMFNATISNLTVFGFKKFYEIFNKEKINLTFAYQPMMMAPYVLDDNTKQHLIQEFKSLPLDMIESLTKSITATPNEIERLAIRDFLKEFTARRKDLTLDIFPETFLQWLELEHVV